MQGKWLKLFLATLALLLVVADGMAQIRRGRWVQSNTVMAEQIPAPTATADGTQPAQPTQPTTVSSGSYVIQEPVYNTRRGLFGRRAARTSFYSEPMYVSQTPTYVAQGQPIQGQPVVQGQPVQGQPVQQPGVVQQPMTTNQPVVTTGTYYYQEPVYRGRFGRRRVAYDNGFYNSSPIYQPVAGTTPIQGRQAFYGPQGGNNSGWLDIRVPAGTVEVFINDVRTTQPGTNRLFITPALDPQKDNVYEIKAKWTGQNGQPIEKSKEIKIQPGQRVVIDFNALDSNTPPTP
jgi:uncharacterized protein (TIGR03000 family)